MKTYKPDKLYNLITALVYILLIFLCLTLPIIIKNAPVENGEIIGIVFFWSAGLLFILVPYCFRLEIDTLYIKTYFLKFCIRNLNTSNVSVVEYGNLFRGGLGYGKGLKGWELVKGRNKYFSYGEKFWGKEAIQEIQRVLKVRNILN